jgi:hypothetical protein
VACRGGRGTRQATCHTCLLSVEFLTLLGTHPAEAACKAKEDFRYGSKIPLPLFIVPLLLRGRIWLSVRHDFQVLTHFMIIDHFYVEKMYYRFPPIALKLSLQKWYGAKKFLHVRTLSPNALCQNGWVFRAFGAARWLDVLARINRSTGRNDLVER